jgi:[ribosomal protein S18]-alanine N-acetyltransferase
MTALIPRTSYDATSGWIFTDMVADDLPQVLGIERASFTNPWSGALFLQELQVAFSRILLARRPGGAIAGYLCRWFVADEVHILNVAVHPLYRTRGVGASLMREALREAREGRAVAVTLEVRRSNIGGRRLYASFGFEEVGARPNYYGRGEDAIILRLALDHE